MVVWPTEQRNQPGYYPEYPNKSFQDWSIIPYERKLYRVSWSIVRGENCSKEMGGNSLHFPQLVDGDLASDSGF